MISDLRVKIKGQKSMNNLKNSQKNVGQLDSVKKHEQLEKEYDKHRTNKLL